MAWSVKDTWATCAKCKEYFERLAVRTTCELCQRVFCPKCKTAVVIFFAHELLGDFSQIIDQCGRNAGQLRTGACSTCRSCLVHRARQRKFCLGKENERAGAITEHYANYRDIEQELGEAFSRFLSTANVEEAEVIRRDISRLTETYRKLGNLLIAMVARPSDRTAAPSSRDIRMSQKLAYVQKNVLTTYISMMHSHTDSIRQSR